MTELFLNKLILRYFPLVIMKRSNQLFDDDGSVNVEHIKERKMKRQNTLDNYFSVGCSKDSQVGHLSNTQVIVNKDSPLKCGMSFHEALSKGDMQYSRKTKRKLYSNKLTHQDFLVSESDSKDHDPSTDTIKPKLERGFLIPKVVCEDFLFSESDSEDDKPSTDTINPKLERDFLIPKSDSEVDDEGKKDTSTDINLKLSIGDYQWKIINRLNLNLSYAKVFSNVASYKILRRLEKDIEYFSGDLLKVRVFGKWHDIPRKQVAFGDDGLSYSFSGNSLPAKPWNTCPFVLELKQMVESLTAETFNFVLINRYANGEDHMGEHRDDERELVAKAPIASLTFGECRPFVFKHKDSRGKNPGKNIPGLKMELESGSLLLMHYPTNKFWYHSLPVRKKALNVRVNLTFRRMVKK